MGPGGVGGAPDAAPGRARGGGNKSGATRLGFALSLKFFQIEGRFPRAKHELPGAAVVHVAEPVGVPPERSLGYDWPGRSATYHRRQIRAFLGFREATVADGRALADWLVVAVRPRDQHRERLLGAVTELVIRKDGDGVRRSPDPARLTLAEQATFELIPSDRG